MVKTILPQKRVMTVRQGSVGGGVARELFLWYKNAMCVGKSADVAYIGSQRRSTISRSELFERPADLHILSTMPRIHLNNRGVYTSYARYRRHTVTYVLFLMLNGTIRRHSRQAWHAPSRFFTKISATSKAALLNEQECCDGHKIYTDGSRSPKGAGGAAVLFHDDQYVSTMKTHLGDASEWTSLQSELAGLILGLHQALSQPNLRRATLFTDCQSAIRAVTGNSRPDMLVAKFRKILDILLKRHDNAVVSLVWVPGHAGVAGNVAADTSAKSAARRLLTGGSECEGFLELSEVGQLPFGTTQRVLMFCEH